MATFTELVAAVVVHSSAVAFSHFGVMVEPASQVERSQPVAERVVARSPRRPEKVSDCPQSQRAGLIKV